MTENFPEGPGTAVAPVAPTATELVVTNSLDARIRYARQIAAAGALLPRGVTDGLRPDDVDKIAARIFLIAETGNMLGIHPIAALQGVNVIEGKPSIAPALMTALIRKAGHKVRVDLHGKLADGNIAAVATITRCDDPVPFVTSWDLDRAVRAGLIDKVDIVDGKTVVRAAGRSGKPSPWQKYTEAMLKWRALGECARDAAEEALMGAHYTPEELGAVVDEEGVMVAQESLAPAPAPAAPSVPEVTEQEFAQTVADTVMNQDTAAQLATLAETFPTTAARNSWAANYPSAWAYAKAQQVTVDTASGQWVGSLFDLFKMAKDALTAAETTTAPEPTPERLDAAAVQAQGDDPWQTPGAMGEVQSVTTLPEHDPTDAGLAPEPRAGTAREAAKATAHAASTRAKAEREAEQAAQAARVNEGAGKA